MQTSPSTSGSDPEVGLSGSISFDGADTLDETTGFTVSCEMAADDGLNGATSIVTENGTEKISYTPGEAGKTVTFDYTIQDPDGLSDTATVTVETTQGCGSVVVDVNTSDGSSAPDDTQLQVNYNGETYVGTGDRLEARVQRYDDGREASISKDDITLPSGYRLREYQTFNKETGEPDGYPNDQTRSILAF